MDISFILLTWNSRNYLELCLKSIHKALENTDFLYEIHILDNGSQDGTSELLAELAKAHPDSIFPYFEPQNTGTTKSRNRLLKSARGNYLCIMDSDAELQQGVIEVLVKTLASDAKLGIVVPRILYPSGKWQKSFDKFQTLIDKLNRFFRLRLIEEQEGRQLDGTTQPFYIDYAISAFWLMRRDLLAKIGYLDEAIFYSPEDMDYCLRVWKGGYKILYIPSVSIIHHTQELSRGLKINKAKLSHLKGLLYYFNKHNYFINRPKFDGLS